MSHFFIGLLVVIAALNALIFYPYLGTLIFAMTLAIIFQPLYRSFIARLPNYPSMAAACTMLAILLIVFVPLSVFGALVFDQAQGLYASFSEGSEVTTSLRNIVDAVTDFLPTFGAVKVPAADVSAIARSGLEYIVKNFGAVFSGLANAALQTILLLFALYFFLRDGKYFKDTIVQLSPLRDVDDKLIFDRLESVVNAVIKGSLLIALLQGIVAGIGYVIFGLPNAALWGAATVLTALIPGIGTAVVFVPGAFYLAGVGAPGMSIGLLLWGFIVVGLIDNVLRPKLISRGAGIHPFFILLSVLGGLSVFGVSGFLLGPLLLSFLLALLQLYNHGAVAHEH